MQVKDNNFSLSFEKKVNFSLLPSRLGRSLKGSRGSGSLKRQPSPIPNRKASTSNWCRHHQFTVHQYHHHFDLHPSHSPKAPSIHPHLFFLKALPIKFPPLLSIRHLKKPAFPKSSTKSGRFLDNARVNCCCTSFLRPRWRAGLAAGTTLPVC
jgi:hypothetical protein